MRLLERMITELSLIHWLVYAMTCTRPALSWIITKLSQHLSCPTSSDWILLKQDLRYVQGTLHYALKYTKTHQMELIGYSDADWASDKEDRRSTMQDMLLLSDPCWTCNILEDQKTTNSCSEYMWIRVYGTCWNHSVTTLFEEASFRFKGDCQNSTCRIIWG